MVLIARVLLAFFRFFLHISLIYLQLSLLFTDILARALRGGWPSPLKRLPLLHRQAPFLIWSTLGHSLDLPFYLIDDLIDLMVLKEWEAVRVREGGERRDYCFALAHEVQQFQVVELVVAPCGIELRLAQQIQPLGQSDPYVSSLDIEVVALPDLCSYLRRRHSVPALHFPPFLLVSPNQAILCPGRNNWRFFFPTLPVFLHGEYTLTIKLIVQPKNNQ